MSGTFQTIETADGSFRAWVTKPAAGSGPGLVLLPEIFGLNDFMRLMAERFAEEGYVCFVPDLFWRVEPDTALAYDEAPKALDLRERFDVDQGATDLGHVVAALRAHPDQAGKVGAVGWCFGGLMATLTALEHDIDCAVAYYPTGMEHCADALGGLGCPVVLHLGEDDDKVPAAMQARLAAAAAANPRLTSFVYPGCRHGFASPGRDVFDKPAAMMAHSRTMALLREVLGPVYDLGALWEKHTEYEFASRDVDATMATMVDEPYVNHIPTMTGGVGHDHLKRFYKYHFVDSNPPDTRLIPVSRTVGADRLVDEMIFCFTHTCEIPWMLPGIEPTGEYVEIPLVAIVNFRGDKLYHEHIYWDQASVLVQIGKLAADDLPVAGIETARKLVDETLPSNELMGATWDASAGKPL
ncbi:MAG: dienelactone hydrolase family protein [Gammaproteobacteria bacterium]